MADYTPKWVFKQQQTQPLQHAFTGFYEPHQRAELTGSNPYSFNWLPHDRPAVPRYFQQRGKKKNQQKPIGGAEEQPGPEERPDGRYGWGAKGHQFEPIGIGPRSGYNLYNVRTGQGEGDPALGQREGHDLRNVRNVGYGMERAASTSPTQSYAGGGNWGGVSGQIGPRRNVIDATSR